MIREDKPSLTETPSSRKRTLLFQAGLCVAVILLLLRYLHVWSSYPFYFMWDMDLVTVTDSVLINSALLPDHINHTGFGMYLLFFITERVVGLFYDLSVMNLTDISTSLNPVAGMAELTDLLRLHSPFIALGTVLLLWAAVCRYFNVSRWLSLLVLVALGTHEALLYNSAMIRTELYSVFYWSGAIGLIVLAAKSRHRLGSGLLTLATGLCLGLCFLTKVQSLLYVAFAALLLLTLRSLSHDKEQITLAPTTGRLSRWAFGLPLLNLAFFLCVGIAAFRTEVPQGIGTYESGYGVTPILVLATGALVILAALQVTMTLRGNISSPVFAYSTLFNLMITGVLLAFFCHLLLYADIYQSFKYMLWDFKMVFFRQSGQMHMRTVGHYWRTFMAFMRYNRTPYIILIGLTIFFPVAGRLRMLKLSRSSQVLLGLLTLLCLMNSTLLSRAWPRDTIWQGMLLNFLNVFLILLLMVRCCRHQKLLRGMAVALLIILLTVNYIHAADMPDRVDANYNHFGWWRQRWFGCVFGGNQRLYLQKMREPYDSGAAGISVLKAIDHYQTRRLANYVFGNQDLTHRNIGAATEGAPVWASQRQWRIAQIPQVLRRGIVVDNADLPLKPRGRFVREYVMENSEQLDKLRPKESTDLLAVLTRSDVTVLLFVDQADVDRMARGSIRPTEYRITLEDQKQRRELHGLAVTNYSEIPVSRIKNRFFFILISR